MGLSQPSIYASSELLLCILSLMHGYQAQTRYGRTLGKVCAAFKGREIEINERVICVESHWKRTTMQLDFIKQIWQSLDNEHQTIQIQILQVLISKLNMTISKLEKCSKTKESHIIEVKKLKYVLTKQHLDEAIEDLASWQKMFDPSWFLILKISSPFIDQELHRNKSAISSINSTYSLRDALKEHPVQKVPIFLPKDELERAQMLEIPFASARRMQRVGSDKWFVIDCHPCDLEANINTLTRDVRELARKLSSVDPLTFGILQCRGVVRIVKPNANRPCSFDFVFRIPGELSNEPRSLRSYLFSNFDITLTNRFELAKQMAKSINYVHTLGFVHKNVRPENFLGFQKNDSNSDLFFLVGFENMRSADGRTLQSGDSTWEKNLYRHPNRQGLHPEDVYSMQHDIYSLGVCLLEVGMWESFLLYTDSGTAPFPSVALGVALESPELNQPARMKEHLVALAKRDLPRRMGDRYEKVVINCLTCLDQDNPDFSDQSEFEDPDGVLVGVKYIEKVS